MNAEEYERMYRLEDSYWWFVGRHRLVLGFLERIYGRRQDLRILDLGCGTGAMSARMARFGSVVSADFSPLALGFTRRRHLSRLCAADAMRLPFRAASFDLVVALDILEHLSDDQAAAREIARVLRPGGRLVTTVPAYRALWSGHDVALMHHRRYVARELTERLRRASLQIERCSYAMTLLCPAVWLYRRLFSHTDSRARATLVHVPGWANRLLIRLLEAENRLIPHVSLPFGVTVFCMARRP